MATRPKDPYQPVERQGLKQPKKYCSICDVLWSWLLILLFWLLWAAVLSGGGRSNSYCVIWPELAANDGQREVVNG